MLQFCSSCLLGSIINTMKYATYFPMDLNWFKTDKIIHEIRLQIADNERVHSEGEVHSSSATSADLLFFFAIFRKIIEKDHPNQQHWLKLIPFPLNHARIIIGMRNFANISINYRDLLSDNIRYAPAAFVGCTVTVTDIHPLIIKSSCVGFFGWKRYLPTLKYLRRAPGAMHQPRYLRIHAL